MTGDNKQIPANLRRSVRDRLSFWWQQSNSSRHERCSLDAQSPDLAEAGGGNLPTDSDEQEQVPKSPPQRTYSKINLMGKRMHRRPARHNTWVRGWQSSVYNFLERPRGYKALAYHVLMFLLVFVCLVLTVVSTIPAHEKEATNYLFKMELLLVLVLTSEFVLRIWSAGCRSRFQKLVGRLRYLKQPFTILDLIICISSTLILLLRNESGTTLFAANGGLRGLRFLQILRLVRMDRRGGTWKLLGSVIYIHRQELLTTFYIGFLGLIFSSFLVYQAEKKENKEQFGTYAHALWWGIVTLTTVGYGDAAPVTWLGKLTASFFAIMGISFFALPAGILGSGFALKVQQQQRQKHLARRRQPAATLIQCLWRCYVADEESLSVATWLIHVRSRNRSFARFCVGNSLMNKISPHRKSSNSGETTNYHAVAERRISDKSIRKASGDSNASNFGVTRLNDYSSMLSLNVFGGDKSSQPNSRKNSNDTEEDSEVSMLTQLRPKHKTAIRFIRKLKFFVSRRKFKEALKPYDVKDVIEQYSAGHIDLLSRVKSLQNKLEAVVGAKDKKKHDESKLTMSSRIIRVESQLVHLERKLDHLINMYRRDQEKTRHRRLSTAVHHDSDETTTESPQQASTETKAFPPSSSSLLKPTAMSREQLARSCSQPTALDSSGSTSLRALPSQGSTLVISKNSQSSPSVSRCNSFRIIPK